MRSSIRLSLAAFAVLSGIGLLAGALSDAQAGNTRQEACQRARDMNPESFENAFGSFGECVKYPGKVCQVFEYPTVAEHPETSEVVELKNRGQCVVFFRQIDS